MYAAPVLKPLRAIILRPHWFKFRGETPHSQLSQVTSLRISRIQQITVEPLQSDGTTTQPFGNSGDE